VIDPDLIVRLRLLCEYAQRAGAPPAWLVQSADSIASALMILQHTDPRRRRSLAKAAVMASALKLMRERGFTHGAAVAALCERHRLRRSQVYALLKMYPGT
jgi:hypothetical protein